MSDTNLSPAKGSSNKQVILVAVLGVVLLLALVFFVLKPFGGGDTASSATDTSSMTTPAPSDASVAPAPAPEAQVQAEPAPAPPRGRNPFDPPR